MKGSNIRRIFIFSQTNRWSTCETRFGYRGASCWLQCLEIVLALILASLCALAPGYGQVVSATLSGTVADPGGAVVPGASVTIVDADTGIATETKTNAAGNYTFPHLQPGNYTLTVRMTGFKVTTITGIELLVNQKARVDARLQVGSVSTVVNVRGATPIVDTSTASVGTVIGGSETVDLPLNLREFGALAVLVPGTVSDNGGFASFAGGSTFSQTPYDTNGERDASNNILIDGVVSRNLKTGGFALQPTPDAVQEFKIQTNVYDAAFGETAGSTINLVTKSGTNQFHGTVYEFLRNQVFDGRNFFAVNQTNPVTGAELPGTAKPKFDRNQFGFTFGGPIQKSKTFFFGNFEGLRQIQGQSIASETPSPQQLGGNFSSFLTGQPINLCGVGGPANLNFDSGQLFNPATETLFTCPAGSAKAGSSVLVGNPIPGNIITAANPVTEKLLATNPFPTANRPGFPNFVNQAPLVRRDNEFDVRVDHTFGPKDEFFARYLFGQTYLDTPSNFPDFSTLNPFRGQNLALGWTHTISPNLLNDARFGFQRDTAFFLCGANCPRPSGFLESLGVENLRSVGGSRFEAFPVNTFVNFGTIGDYLTPDREPDMVQTYQDNLTWVHGRQTIIVGTSLQPWQILGEGGPCFGAGLFNFTGQYSSLGGEVPGVSGISDLADFLLGFPASADKQLTFVTTNKTGGAFLNWYGQDDIKISPNLTLNLGLRYEYRRFATDKNNDLVSLVQIKPPFSAPGNALIITPYPDAQNNALCNNAFVLTPDGRCLVASAAERAALGFTGRTQRTLVFPDLDNFAPRVGVAWRPRKSDKLVVRAGYGVFYDMASMNQQEFGNILVDPIATYAPPFGAPPPLTNGVPTTFENVFAGAAGVPPISEQDGLYDISPYYRTPTVQEWSFGIESQLSTNWALEFDYIGNSGRYLDFLHNPGNQPLPGSGPLQPRRPYPDFGPDLYTSSDAISNYNSLQAKLTRRFSSGLTALISYTWSKAIDDSEGDEGFSGGVGNGNAQNDNNPLADYGPSYINAPQRLVASFVYQLPVGGGKRFLNTNVAVMNEILGNWEVSGIATFQSGFPFSVLSSQDFSNTGSSNPRPERTCNGVGPKTINEWFNPACFTVAPLAAAFAAGAPTFGNSGRNILTGPGINNWDLALLKNVHITERLALELRFEFYNAFNHANFGAPVSTVGNTAIGELTSAGSPRDIQFAAKLSF
jgi:hypothetical protein